MLWGVRWKRHRYERCGRVVEVPDQAAAAVLRQLSEVSSVLADRGYRRQFGQLPRFQGGASIARIGRKYGFHRARRVFGRLRCTISVRKPSPNRRIRCFGHDVPRASRLDYQVRAHFAKAELLKASSRDGNEASHDVQREEKLQQPLSPGFSVDMVLFRDGHVRFRRAIILLLHADDDGHSHPNRARGVDHLGDRHPRCFDALGQVHLGRGECYLL
mmetsp:Transcript_3997/g.15445  ORF Transcript_3997/g.15445 Transcript_3997/m.15445 type:complete len:216 (-) Transcript_3997:1503-2150(-)